MEIEQSIFLIQFLLIFRRSGDVLFFLYARRLRGYTPTDTTTSMSPVNWVSVRTLEDVGLRILQKNLSYWPAVAIRKTWRQLHQGKLRLQRIIQSNNGNITEEKDYNDQMGTVLKAYLTVVPTQLATHVRSWEEVAWL